MPFARIVLFLVAVAGWAVLGFGGWIAWRGVVLYAGDAVLMGTGGGLMLGGLLVIALTVGALAQVATARDVAALRRLAEARPARAAAPPARAEAPAKLRPVPDAGRVEPRLKR